MDRERRRFYKCYWCNCHDKSIQHRIMRRTLKHKLSKLMKFAPNDYE